MCRHDLTNINVNNIPISVNLAYLVEKAQNANSICASDGADTDTNADTNCITNSSNKPNIVPSITVSKLVEPNTVYKTIIGQMKISNLKLEPHLVLIVVDKSGSMAGNPMINVHYSLERIIDVNYQNSHIVSHVVTYDNYAESFEIDTKNSIQTYKTKIKSICGGGGTCFSSAFKQIFHICRNYFDSNISHGFGGVSIIFLTDGEDMTTQCDRPALVENFKKELSVIIKSIPYTVHTIGFGAYHDFNFLNQLKECGSISGAYRYADPSENSDILSSKINSILDVVMVTNNITVNILETCVPIIFGQYGTFWLNLTGWDTSIPCKFTMCIGSNLDTETYIVETYVVDSNDPQLLNQWFSHLIDDIADEVLVLSNQEAIKSNLSHKLHCELVRQRSKAIMVRSSQFPKNIDRLEKILEMIESIINGDKIDKLKITDIKFEGKFETKISSSKPTIPSTITNNSISYNLNNQPVCKWTTITRPIRKCKTNDYFYDLIVRQYEYTALNAIKGSSVDPKYFLLAASFGKISLVKHFVNEKYQNVSDANGLNSCDLALLNGFWISAEILIDANYLPNSSYEDLLRSCLNYGYVKTAKILVDKSLVEITENMIQSCPYENCNWLKNNSTIIASTQTMINQGMYTDIENQIEKIENLTWKSFLKILETPTDDHIKIFELLIQHNKLNAHEILETIDNPKSYRDNPESYRDNPESYRDNPESYRDNDITWPFFIACKNGCTKLFDILIKYQTETTINMQNKKGTTALWIACCNKHVDTVMSLVLNGADPNISNYKGDSALIPAIQKNSDTIVKLLLEAGIQTDVYNKNRDTPIIICCRLGQSKILEICLNHIPLEKRMAELSICADIDGFNALLAAAEQDRVQCITICEKFGANLEFRTSDTNSILEGATALHIATHYGNISSVKKLCEIGANPQSQTSVHGYTCLHIAIKQKYKNIVSYLISTYPHLITIADNNGMLPVTYAKATGNESILENFFNNKLELLMSDMIFSDSKDELECSNIITKYSTSLGCYEHDKIINLEIDQHNITKMALLSGKKTIAKYLLDVTKSQNSTKKSIDNMVLFWDIYLNNSGICQTESESGSGSESEIQIMIDRINKVRINNIQNKMLLNLPTSSYPKMLIDNKPSVVILMTDGYYNNVNSQTITQIKETNSNPSLLGFLEKLKNNKIFPDGKECLEYIVWNAKIHMIELVANGETILQPIHLMAIYLYSSNVTIYCKVNNCMNKWLEKENELWHPFVYCLYNAIELCPIYEGEVYRAVCHKFEPQKYIIGQKITTGGFTITSTEWSLCTDLINKKCHMIFIIRSIMGRNISLYSKHMINREVVFLPGSEFIVSDVYVGNLFVLGQANIRKNYKATEKDFAKAANSEINIIIELQETYA